MENINLHFLTNYQDTKTETISKCKKYTINSKWKNLTVDITKPADYYIIQNHPGNNKFIPNKSILFYNEPILTRGRWKKWEDNAGLLYSYKIRNWNGWGLTWSYNDLMTIPIFKMQDTKIISTITSDLQIYPGHKLRLIMVQYLDKIKDIIPHIYGRKNYSNSILDKLDNYKGELKYKDTGLFKYHYHFAAENSQEYGYLSEKLIDPILSETLCFYWGDYNTVKTYIPDKSYIFLDITRPKLCIDIIKKSMQNNEREKRLKYIKEAKYKILNELSIMPLVYDVINKKV
jgi:hypothetical protein